MAWIVQVTRCNESGTERRGGGEQRKRETALLCDRGWTEHLHHLIYDPLRCTDNKREKAHAASCARRGRARVHRRGRINLHMDVTGAENGERGGREEADWNTDWSSLPRNRTRSPLSSDRGGVRTISMSHESDTGIMPCRFDWLRLLTAGYREDG